MIHREVVIAPAEGLHALVAHHLAGMAEQFRSSLFLRSEKGSASVRDVVGVLALALPQGETVSVWADGVDEREALDAIVQHLASLDDTKNQ